MGQWARERGTGNGPKLCRPEPECNEGEGSGLSLRAKTAPLATLGATRGAQATRDLLTRSRSLASLGMRAPRRLTAGGHLLTANG